MTAVWPAGPGRLLSGLLRPISKCGCHKTHRFFRPAASAQQRGTAKRDSVTTSLRHARRAGVSPVRARRRHSSHPRSLPVRLVHRSMSGLSHLPTRCFEIRPEGLSGSSGFTLLISGLHVPNRLSPRASQSPDDRTLFDFETGPTRSI